MKSIRIYICGVLAIITMAACNKKSQEPEYESKQLECEVQFKGYESDTVITVFEFSSTIKDIQNDTDWLIIEIKDSVPNNYKLGIICSKNVTSSVRKAEIVVVCKNGDTLTLKVTQDVLDEIEDIHNNVTDQPAYVPSR